MRRHHRFTHDADSLIEKKKLLCSFLQAELNIRANLRKLTASLSHINDVELKQMTITEYLIYMSKQNCDFKAIKNAIISSHDDLDLEIDFLPVGERSHAICPFPHYFLPIDLQTDHDRFDVIQIPVKEILLRLRQNTNLFDILLIRNKRFQRSNVLGETLRMHSPFCDFSLKA